MEAANGFMASTITLRIGSSKPEGPAASAIFCRSSTVRSWAKRERLAGRTIRASNSLKDFMAEEDIIRAGDFHTRQALSSSLSHLNGQTIYIMIGLWRAC